MPRLFTRYSAIWPHVLEAIEVMPGSVSRCSLQSWKGGASFGSSFVYDV